MTEKSRQIEIERLRSPNESHMNREWIMGLSPKEHRLGESETKINREAQEEEAPVHKMNNKGIASGGRARVPGPVTHSSGAILCTLR